MGHLSCLFQREQPKTGQSQLAGQPKRGLEGQLMPHPAPDEPSTQPLMESVKRRNGYFSTVSVFRQTITEISALVKCCCHQTTEMKKGLFTPHHFQFTKSQGMANTHQILLHRRDDKCVCDVSKDESHIALIRNQQIRQL